MAKVQQNVHANLHTGENKNVHKKYTEINMQTHCKNKFEQTKHRNIRTDTSNINT